MVRTKHFATVFVVAFSFLLLPSLILAQPSERPEEDVLGRFPWGRSAILDLTPEQMEKLRELRAAHREASRGHMEEMWKLQLKMRELMADPDANEKEIKSLYGKISGMRAEQFSRSLEQRKEVRKIFTPEQLEKLGKFRSRMAGRSELMKDRFPGRRGAGMRGVFPHQGRCFLWMKTRHFQHRPFMPGWWW